MWSWPDHRERGFVGDASMVIGRFWNLTLQYPCDVTLTAGRVIVIVPYSFRSIAVVPRSQWPWVGRTIPFRESIQKDSCAEWQDHHDLYWRSLARPTYGSQDAQPTSNYWWHLETLRQPCNPFMRHRRNLQHPVILQPLRALPNTLLATDWVWNWFLNHPESRLARRAVAAFVYGSFSCKHIVTVWWVFVVFVFVNMKFLSDVFDFEFWMKDTMKVELMNEKTWNTWRNMEHTMNNFSKWQKVTQKGGPTGWSVVVIDSDRR